LARDDLTFLSYSVLVLVGRSGASPHDFVQMMRAGRVYQTASPSQYYAEPKRLELLGYLTSTKEPGKTRERTVYRLTDMGLDALRRWAHEPVAFPGVHGEPPIKMLAADLVGEAPVRASLLAMRDEMASLRAELDLADDRADAIPHRAKYLHLNHRLSRRILDCYDEWLEDVERELG
jgi:DNA-binding PadR family transcriptional regulator